MTTAKEVVWFGARMAGAPTDHPEPVAMQINVVEYLERGALVTCPHKTAIVDGTSRYSFADVERYATRCASLLIKRRAGTSVPIAVFFAQGCRHDLRRSRGLTWASLVMQVGPLAFCEIIDY